MADNEKKSDNTKPIDRHHPFENQIFHHYRKTKTGINAAIQLLKNHGYVIYEKQKEVSADNE